MVVDYSKWDKLELSDDSDIEVHPNVDKKSFIRWKQRDIHEKRELAKARMKQLELNTEMNRDLLQRVDKLIAASATSTISLDVRASVVLSAEGLDKKQPALATEGAPQYNDMIESLLVQIKQGIETGHGREYEERATIEQLKEHKAKLEQALEAEAKELNQLIEEKKNHISSEDIHTGFDSTLINKQAKQEETPKPTTSKSTASSSAPSSSIEVINTPGQPSTSTSNAESEVEASPDAIEFAKIPIGEYSKCYSYLSAHRNIVNEQEKDGLMMLAFEQELAGQRADMKRTIHNALLIQYCSHLGSDGVRLLFSRIASKDHPAVEALNKDVEFTSNHVIERCKVLRDQDTQTEGVEQIQLHAVDPNTEILIHVPEEGSEEWDIYQSFSKDLRDAILTKKLDEINKVLGDIEVGEAEEIVQLLNESGVLSVEEKIYDATKWDEEREKLENEHAHEEEEVGLTEASGPVQSSVDDVD